MFPSFLEERPFEGEVLSDPAVDLSRAHDLRNLPSVIMVRGKGAEVLAYGQRSIGLSVDELEAKLLGVNEAPEGDERPQEVRRSAPS